MKNSSIWIIILISLPSLWSDYQPHLHPAYLEKVIRTHTLPRRTMVLSAQVSGPISNIELDLSETADGKRGFSIDSKKAELQLENLQTILLLRQSEVENQRIILKRAQSELSFQEKELSRLKKMEKGGGATQQQIDQQKLSFELSKLNQQEQKSQLEMLALRVLQAEIDVKFQQDYLSRHREVAPKGWKVISRSKEVGEMCSPGMPVLSLAQLAPLRLAFQVNETEAQALIKDKLVITMNGKNVPWDRHHLSPEIESLSRKRKVELLLPESTPIDSGKEVLVRFSLPDPQRGILIPEDYVRTAFGQKIITDSKGKKLPIQTLRKSGSSWVVSPEDLPEGISLIKVDREEILK